MIIMSAMTSYFFGSCQLPVFARALKQPAAKATGGVRLRPSPRPPRRAVVYTRAIAEVRQCLVTRCLLSCKAALKPST